MVGRHYPELDIFITSPNMDTLTEPLLGTQTVHLRRDLHYGEHDPCLMPQPFDNDNPHLACLHYPGMGTHRIFWSLPSKESFEPLPGHNLSDIPLGHLPPIELEQLHGTFMDLKLILDSPPPAYAPDGAPSSTALNADLKVKEYQSRFHYLFTRLADSAIYSEAAMLWRIAQRNLLELDARITWLQLLQPKFTVVHSSWQVPDPRPLVGAPQTGATF